MTVNIGYDADIFRSIIVCGQLQKNLAPHGVLVWWYSKQEFFKQHCLRVLYSGVFLAYNTFSVVFSTISEM